MKTLGLSEFYETLAQYNERHGVDNPRARGIILRTFISYIDRKDRLIVRPYKGEGELQAHRFNIREVIGTFGATDIEAARATANRLRGAR